MTNDRINEFDAELMSRLQRILDDRVARQHCPSVVATIFQGNRVLMESGVGERTLGAAPPDTQTAYRIASCSKSFTIVTLLLLRDRGLVNLDAPITHYVTEFTQGAMGRTFDAPSVRMLMSMSGGLPTDDPWADRQESISNATFSSLVAGGALLTTTPGAEFQYSNFGYALLGQVIERVSGRPFGELVADEVLRPLRLHETGYERNVVAPEQLAYGYRPGLEGWVELPFAGPGAFSSIGGLFSSARDMRTWARWLSSALGDEPDERGPLSVTSRREMQQIVTVIPNASNAAILPRHAERTFGYGYGLFVEHDRRLGQFVSHSGGYPGYSSHMRWHVPTGLGVVALENARYSGAAQTASSLIDEVLDTFDFTLGALEVWPITRELALAANTLVTRWDDKVAARIFEENVALDVPYLERRVLIERALDDVGGLDATQGPRFHDERSDSALHLIWTLAGARGELTCELRVSPKTPALIQSFNVRTS